ncbi:MAG: hypothetical protein AAF741_15665 [Bacteroidota bacterium]
MAAQTDAYYVVSKGYIDQGDSISIYHADTLVNGLDLSGGGGEAQPDTIEIPTWVGNASTATNLNGNGGNNYISWSERDASERVTASGNQITIDVAGRYSFSGGVSTQVSTNQRFAARVYLEKNGTKLPEWYGTGYIRATGNQDQTTFAFNFVSEASSGDSYRILVEKEAGNNSAVNVSTGGTSLIVMALDGIIVDGVVGQQGPPGVGQPGPQGDAATITVGTVTASSPGGAPSFTNVGTPNEAIFNVVLPRGDTGPPGPQGPPDGDGFTGGSYDPGTGIVTFTSDDGLGFSTGDLRGEDGDPGAAGTDGDGFTGGSYNSSTGIVTFSSDDGLGFSTGDLRGEDGDPGVAGTDGDGFTGGSYNSSTGVVTFTSDDGLGFSTGDLRGEDGDPGAAGSDGDGFTGGSYDPGTGVVTFTSDDGLGFSTGDLRGEDGSSGGGEYARARSTGLVFHSGTVIANIGSAATSSEFTYSGGKIRYTGPSGATIMFSSSVTFLGSASANPDPVWTFERSISGTNNVYAHTAHDIQSGEFMTTGFTTIETNVQTNTEFFLERSGTTQDFTAGIFINAVKLN